MKKTYNLSEIMTRACAIRKNAAVEMGCKASEVIWGECLKMAWAEAESVNAEANACEIVREWGDLGDDGQVKMMTSCVRKAAKNEIGYSSEDHYLQFSEVPAFKCFRPHDFDEFVSETCIRVLDKLGDIEKLTATNERRAAQGKPPLRLVSLVYNAARASIAAVYYQDGKHDAADWEIDDGDGNTASFLETMVASDRDNTERSAIIRATLVNYWNTLDKIGQRIMELLAVQMTEREIARTVGISNVAVHKRIVKMRAALEHLRTA